MLSSLVCLLAALAAPVPQPVPATARVVVTRAIEALGGEIALKNITALDIDSIGHEYYIDQSERPEGPFVVNYLSTSEQREWPAAARASSSSNAASSRPTGAGPARPRSSMPTALP
jgi:hypothetical protein